MGHMDWKTASAYYESRLSAALSVQRYASALASLPQTEVPTTLKDVLLQEAEPARRQLERLRKREFRIAVVGLEKAGKSTFINAWLECDLLPAKAARCTFTTTQIYSVVKDTDQKLEVQVKTEEQFRQLLSDLERENAQEDLNTCRRYETTLRQVREDGDRTIQFTRLEQIRNDLKKYVADEQYAHAVLEARLYTNKLAQAEGIVFYDVPGLDSGLAKHVDEAQDMLSDCDAVILVQRFPSLREKELAIIKFTEQGDQHVTVADKLFVFLSRIDSQATPEALQQHVEDAYKDWQHRSSLPRDRIVYGSAGAYLVLNGLAEPQTQTEIGYADDLRQKLKTLLKADQSDITNIEREGTGIPQIKQKIFNYINHERVAILQKRCEASISKIINTSEDIYHLVKKRYPENPEEAKRVEEDRRRIAFSEWWSTKWEQIKAKLQRHYDSSVICKNPMDEMAVLASSLEKFKQRYFDIVKAEMVNLRDETFRKKDDIFSANSYPEFDKVKVNYAWREEIYRDISGLLAAIAHQLAFELKEEALELIAYMTHLLWGSHEVKVRLIGYSEEDFLNRLETSLSVLFLRFARPVAEALIRGPVNSDLRDKVVKSLGVDIEIVDNYYTGEEDAYKVLKRYVKYGFELLFDAELRQKILGVSKITSPFINMTVQLATDAAENIASTLRSPQEQVIFEIESDINAFEEYLCYAIFNAAGFEAYCMQELRRLVDSFRDKEGTWAGVAQNEWLQGNPQLLAEIPNDLKSYETDLEVSERLRQLAVTLRNFAAPGVEFSG